MTISSNVAAKRVPQRTCVGCRQVKARKDLIRLVRTPDNVVEVDIAGKKPGRGAYICRAPACWERGLKGGNLEHTLKTNLTRDDKERLIRAGSELMMAAE